ncbi:MAG: c-type cytochrome [Planctomycetes bacterium]|nr:c-type cytochrome [Planctomycetota bacterium]
MRPPMPWLCACLVLSPLASQSKPAPFDPPKGARICLLGNALAERMQHHGWFETLLQLRFPARHLVVRNLGFGADELSVHQRTMNFGKLSSDAMGSDLQHGKFVVWDRFLTHCKADIVLAFFGFNESFADRAGLPKFRADLTEFIRHVAASKYNGKTPPQLVLFSSLPFENTGNRSLPDGREHNRRIELYTAAAAEVAAEHAVRFVDLGPAMRESYRKRRAPLTINGIHLSEEGNRQVAHAIAGSLWGGTELAPPGSAEALRRAVLDKNFHWHQRYRVTDGYNVYGGRSKKVYGTPDGKEFANYAVLQREMDVLDAMTANRDSHVWSLAAGQPTPIDDSKLPAQLPVRTNKPGPGPAGTHLYLSGSDALAKMTPAKGMKVELFADEARFPELVNPVQMAWDTKGRLWVAVWPTYPHWRPGAPRNDKLLILEDTDGDGRADVCKVFAGDLLNPTGFEFWNGGVFVAAAPDLLFLKDTDGDDRADRCVRVLHGLSSADTHHTANSFVLGPDGALYFQEGTFHRSQIESVHGPVRNRDACVWRFDPRTWSVERYVPYNFANPHGHVFDHWGQDFVTDGTGNVNYYALPFSGHVAAPAKHRGYFPFFRQRSRPAAATEILSSSHFPAANQGSYLIANVIGFLGIFQYRVLDDGSGFRAEEIEPIVQSTDPNFRPSDIEVGPDGALYFLDWHNAIIGHLQHHIRDPSRDTAHGRVYRVSCPGRPKTQPAAIAGRPIPELLRNLENADDRVRYRTHIELSARDSDAVLAAADAWLAALDSAQPDYAHHRLEGLWLQQQHDRVDPALLRALLRDARPQVRAAATRVLRHAAAKLADGPALLAKQAADPHPRVRLEAVVAASFLDSASAAAAALEALRHPTDRFLDYALDATIRQLAPRWQAALQAGEAVVAADNPAGIRFLLGRVTPAELRALPRTPAVLQALLQRHMVPAELRREAAAALAAQHKTSTTAELLAAVRALDQDGGTMSAHTVRDLGALLHEELAKQRQEAPAALIELARNAATPAVRALGYGAWLASGGEPEAVWRDAEASTDRLCALLDSIPTLHDAGMRNALYARIRPLMFDLPPALAEKGAMQGLAVAYYRPAPSDARLSTFNAARPSKRMSLANFTLGVSTEERGGSFGMLFRGTLQIEKAGQYTFFLASDDGSRLFVDGKCVVDNDGHHPMRERRGRLQLAPGPHAIVLTYFDQGGDDGLRVAWRGPGFGRQPIPDRLLGRGGTQAVRTAAIRAVGAVPGHDAEKLEDAARLLGDTALLDATVGLLRGVTPTSAPATAAERVATGLVTAIERMPAGARASATAIAAVDVTKALGAALPAATRDPLLRRLHGLVPVTVLIETVPHKMRYDVEEFWAEAGKPLVVTFRNNDMMPHNLVITARGAREKIGRAAEQLSGIGNARQRAFVPDLPEVLWHTRLLYPGESQRLELVAPATTGSYPFVCTFPGHWTVMHGVMQVVERIDPAQHVTRRADATEPAPTRKFVRNWTVADFDAALKGDWQRGRSAHRGAALFTTAGCVKCHDAAKGATVGPDLAKIGTKYAPRDLLRHVLEPSASILLGYESYYLELDRGEPVVGRILREDATSVQVVANPDKPDAITRVPKQRITAREKSPFSTMPTGLLVTLERDEVLDLLAYLTKLGR